MSKRIVFLGSPDFAIPSLRELALHYPVVGVVTQPDRPAGRGRRLSQPPVKLLAQELSIPIYQPTRLRGEEALNQLKAWQPDLIVVTAYGQILKPEVLDLPEYGCINVHASLLPRWRGAAPIQAAILHGDEKTGITLMKMDPGLDTGPILRQQSIPIHYDDTSETLSARLSELGAYILIEILPDFLAGKIQPITQNDDLATYAPMLKKDDGRLDFTHPAEYLERQVRAYHPWPGSFIVWEATSIKILQASWIKSLGHALQPGEAFVFQGLPAIATSEGSLVLEHVHPAGKKPMPGKTFLLGARNWPGSMLESK